MRGARGSAGPSHGRQGGSSTTQRGGAGEGDCEASISFEE